ncbi:MAG: hypothetical protein CSA63_00425 [Propionibacterium sp.]|nr:MAG: hypothetical protein CSA63_00425 [Propionibacterium sp.]
MARPTSKQELQDAAETNYQKILDLLAQFTPEQQQAQFAFADRDRTVRDVIWHLHVWHTFFEQWYRVGMAGGKPEMPAPGHTWTTLPMLNVEIWQQAQGIELAAALASFEQSHRRIGAIIERHSDEELFTKRYYPWTNTTSMGTYLISTTSSHYDWALKKLRRQHRAITKKPGLTKRIFGQA